MQIGYSWVRIPLPPLLREVQLASSEQTPLGADEERSVMNLRIICIVLACGILSTVVEAQETQTLILKDGRRLTGTVTKTPNGYRLDSRIASMTFRDDEVAAVEDALTTEDEYTQRAKALQDDDADGHYDLAEWAYRQNLREEARRHLQIALKINPNHIKAKALLSQLGDSEQTSQPMPGTQRIDTISTEWLIGEDDIQRIRLEELTPSDRVTVRLQNDVVNRFIDMMQGREDFKQPRAAERFRSLRPIQKTHYMLEKIDPDNRSIKDDIIITSDPRFMVDFRRHVWPMIANNCAAAACHGGAEVRGGLKLFNIPVSNERVDYTNYILLDGFMSKGRKMIDRGNPETSLLLSFALPEGQGQFRHPVKIPPMFPNRRAGGYTRIQAWITSLHTAHPDYRLEYKPPFGMKLQWRSHDLLPPVSSEPTTQGADDLLP